ncbi:MAG: mycothiol system anti-sigma-R factor [Cyclobacteriaceae bacterium]|nr:mycothiol system anti-sigma-R factor [Cyclobacteriaceae bacterium]
MPDCTEPSKPGNSLSCMEMLQLILDGDATPEQQHAFKAHLDECMPCYKEYNLDVTLKVLIKSKCNGKGAPPELIEKIKSQISQNLPH